MEQLKAATFLQHARLQELPYFQTLVAFQLPLESYVGHLRALAVIHGALEQALATCQDAAVSSVWRDDMRKLPCLNQDLRFFESRVVPDIKESVNLALEVADAIRLQSLAQPLALLGYLYVLEGSTMGASVLRPISARAFLLNGDNGLSYLRGNGPRAHAHWAQFQKRMNVLQLAPKERDLIAKVAGGFFERLAAIFGALHPFSEDSKVFLVTSINPEAGRHPIPADSREMQAAMQAADLCWQRFPYYEFRYGERGRRFARSDGAWLVTLCQYDQEKVQQQIRWLCRVLSTRGMPTMMLQAKLEILAAKLTEAIPGNQYSYQKLSELAAEVLASRRKHFSDEQFSSLADGFNKAVGQEWADRYKNAGELLVCAVSDELEGFADNTESIRQWLTDSARFPATWIQAAEATLAEARSSASKPS